MQRQLDGLERTLDDLEQGINRQLAERDRLLQAFEELFS